MRSLMTQQDPELGGAGVKFLIILAIIVLIGNAGIHYIPVAYNGASFKQEMDTAVVKGLASSGQMKPLDVVTAHIRKAAAEYEVPSNALVEIGPVKGVVQAHVAFTKEVEMLPFGIYKYKYIFNYQAAPQGYLLKD